MRRLKCACFVCGATLKITDGDLPPGAAFAPQCVACLDAQLASGSALLHFRVQSQPPAAAFALGRLTISRRAALALVASGHDAAEVLSQHAKRGQGEVVSHHRAAGSQLLRVQTAVGLYGLETTITVADEG